MQSSISPDAIRAFLGQSGLEALCRLVDAWPEGAFIATPGGRIQSWNAAAERLTGYSSADVVGRDSGQLGGFTEPCANVVGKLRRAASGGANAARCCRLRTRDGQERVVLRNSILVHDTEGEVVGTLELFTDVTEVPGVCCGARAELLAEEPPGGLVRLIGRHPSMTRVYRAIAMVARSDATVLIHGESGTGKELAAEAVHRLSPRADGPYVRVNCAALNENLLESELFGHVRGAFTGAVQNRRGRFEEASGGSLLLDEIGDIAAGMQAKLLRVLEQHEIDRVGESVPTRVDVRLICATNRDLRGLVDQGAFRSDLYFRLNVFPVRLPPLRERMSDLPILAEHFLQSASAPQSPRLDDAALQLLMGYGWPGNVRELEHALRYASLHAEGGEISVGHLPAEVRSPSSRPSARSDEALGQEIVNALERNGWSRDLASRELGVSRVTLWKQMKRLGITAPLVRARPRSRPPTR